MAKGKKRLYNDRELSWLSFNARVLQEAEDKTNPLLERLKFLGIFSSNRDEFYRVRVATLMRMLEVKIKGEPNFSAELKKQLKDINAAAEAQQVKFDALFGDVITELKKRQVSIINETMLSGKREEFVRGYFDQQVRHRLIPIMLGKGASLPTLRNQEIYLCVRMWRSDNATDYRYCLIEMPRDVLPRFIKLPDEGTNHFVILLDDVIRYGLPFIFQMFDYDRYDAYTIKLTRDAEFDIQDDVTKSMYEKISKSVKLRKEGIPVRFVYDRTMPREFLKFILTRLDLPGFANVLAGGRYHNARDFIDFPDFGLPGITNKPLLPLSHPVLAQSRSIISAIAKGDILLHFPYHTFQHVIDFLREAAIDPKVKSIKMTVYRLAKNSDVINALINARKNDKEVLCVIELQARFDEEANIYWTHKLEEEGVKILNGIPNLKVHAKTILITRSEKGKNVSYAYVGTGNFNESTAQIYSDHGLLTANQAIAGELDKVFQFIENPYRPFKYTHIILSPFNLRNRMMKLIAEEVKIAKKGKPAYISIKMNNLEDRKLIDALYDASVNGVRVRIICRGICCLTPETSTGSNTIEVISIIDRYLEHSRLFIFGNRGNPLVYISSADWMIRNLDHRVEITCPIYDENLRNELLDYFDIQFSDVRKARILSGDLTNKYRTEKREDGIRAQYSLYERLKAQCPASTLRKPTNFRKKKNKVSETSTTKGEIE